MFRKMKAQIVKGVLGKIRRHYAYQHSSLTDYLSYPNNKQEDDSENVKILIGYRNKLSSIDSVIEDIDNVYL